MKVETFALGPLLTNSYLVHHGTLAAVFDVGGDPAPMVEFLRRNDLAVTHIFLTHLHCDHLYGVAELARVTGAPVFASGADRYLMDEELGRGGFMGLPLVKMFEFADALPGESVMAGRPCRILATPGHSPGGLSVFFPQDGVVFVGDLLFSRSVGRTDFPGGDHETLVSAVREKIFILPDDTVVYPGHGPATTVGAEKRHNPFFSEFA
ncbi:MBL fold metallo-hydrolase [Desulfolutivibrio sulfoxidireducens]|uniref:MBL fold metallo-hydrolase n=1 Tax=Desulfolutivibrio sulfoxidireducens TaxID=2773299 RepID=UPI00159DB5CD|nr:MBL fold metallo-hydrolase [Desulfolutivibrio sulfoxidireducens]QLA16827.1 MBL fold metallo-hydrolase [Desulfolutivibrio sulfoxidireducens]QLA20392.1 MBL fold metallo-hydrolase [Desulfolutivibrio sulfoxidireducens]